MTVSIRNITFRVNWYGRKKLLNSNLGTWVVFWENHVKDTDKFLWRGRGYTISSLNTALVSFVSHVNVNILSHWMKHHRHTILETFEDKHKIYLGIVRHKFMLYITHTLILIITWYILCLLHLFLPLLWFLQNVYISLL